MSRPGRRALTRGEVGAVLDELPELARGVTQLAVDNPTSLALLLSGAYLSGKVAAQIVRPRGPLECLALVLVVNAAVAYGAGRLVRSGVVPIRVRIDGELVELGRLGRCPEGPEDAGARADSPA